MGESTAIAWTDHTFNPWWGCTKISPGCDHCYAETFDKRVGGAHWGKGAERRVFGDKHWNEPLKWNAAAAKNGRRARVFCASMADVFDAEAPEGQLERLWALIRATPQLDWQLLTKRPARIARSLPADWGSGYANTQIGTTVENAEQARIRIPVLRAVRAAVRFLSCEPLIEEIAPDLNGIDWVIVGGESGHHARPFNIEWARSLRDQCLAAGVAFFCKQLGARPFRKRDEDDRCRDCADHGPICPSSGLPCDGRLKDRAGADPSEWPADLRVRQFPTPEPR